MDSVWLLTRGLGTMFRSDKQINFLALVVSDTNYVTGISVYQFEYCANADMWRCQSTVEKCMCVFQLWSEYLMGLFSSDRYTVTLYPCDLFHTLRHALVNRSIVGRVYHLYSGIPFDSNKLPLQSCVLNMKRSF